MRLLDTCQNAATFLSCFGPSASVSFAFWHVAFPYVERIVTTRIWTPSLVLQRMLKKSVKFVGTGRLFYKRACCYFTQAATIGPELKSLERRLVPFRVRPISNVSCLTEFALLCISLALCIAADMIRRTKQA